MLDSFKTLTKVKILNPAPTFFGYRKSTKVWRNVNNWSGLDSQGHIYSLLFNCVFFAVGYTMADIRYKWNDGINSVQISNDVSLPQFKVLGHRQKTIEASLSTGKPLFISFILIQAIVTEEGVLDLVSIF